ncbi:thioredoxin fold domain-containing protein [Campylobacter troglodytis]|uniref:cytochrome c biogenesis protein CcdA n=1 Tax=Campylobacter troglodytis TaxID=654363 RepID=UPI003CFBEBF8
MLSKKRAFFLSLVFVFFMSLAYAIAGLITASLGASVQGLLQRPLVILIFAFILVLLALSCFGLFSFSLPQNLARIKGRGFLAVALMGFLSAFIVGPCAAAPLAAALLYIAHSGDLALGGLGLFVLSFGMGVPLLALGLGLGFIKTGEWMQRVNVFFGFLLLFMAVWMMDRFLLDHLTLLLYGILGVFFVVLMGAFEQASSNLAKIKKAILILVLAYSLSLFLGGLWGGKSLLNPLNLSTQSVKQGLNFEFMDDLEKIKTSLNQKALIYFTASWCENCKLLERFTFNDEGLIESLKDFKLIKIDLSDNDSKNALIMKEFEVFAPPVLIFYDENVEFSRLVGFVSSKELLASMP